MWERHLYEAKMQASLVKCADVERTSNFILNGLVCIDSVFELCGTRYNTPILISTTGAAKGKKDKDRNVKWMWFINCINVPNIMCDMKLAVSIFALKHVQHVVRWKPALFADLWGQKKKCPTCDVSDGGMVLMKETDFFEHIIDKHQNQRDSCDCDRTSWIPFFHQENGLRRINFGWALVVFFVWYVFTVLVLLRSKTRWVILRCSMYRAHQPHVGSTTELMLKMQGRDIFATAEVQMLWTCRRTLTNGCNKDRLATWQISRKTSVCTFLHSWCGTCC